MSGVQEQGIAVLQHCRNPAESCFRKGTGNGVRKYIILADYRMFRTVMLHVIAPSASDFSVAGCGGFRLPFLGITEYMRGLVSVYQRPISLVSEF